MSNTQGELVVRNRLAVSLLIPALLALSFAIASLYWSMKFQSEYELKNSALDDQTAAIQRIECPAVNKTALIRIVKGTVEQDQRFATLLQVFAFAMFFVGGLTLFLVWSESKKPDR